MNREEKHEEGAWTHGVVEKLCQVIKNGGRIDRTSICGQSEKYMADSYGFPVMISCQISARCRLPQFYRKRHSARAVHINCFIQGSRDEEADFEDTLCQLSIAAALVASSPDFVDELSPDETYETFAQKYAFCAQLSQEVYNAFKEVT